MVEEESDRCHLRNWKEYGGNVTVFGNWMGLLSSSGVLTSRKYLPRKGPASEIASHHHRKGPCLWWSEPSRWLRTRTGKVMAERRHPCITWSILTTPSCYLVGLALNQCNFEKCTNQIMKIAFIKIEKILLRTGRLLHIFVDNVDIESDDEFVRYFF